MNTSSFRLCSFSPLTAKHVQPKKKQHADALNGLNSSVSDTESVASVVTKEIRTIARSVSDKIEKEESRDIGEDEDENLFITQSFQTTKSQMNKGKYRESSESSDESSESDLEDWKKVTKKSDKNAVAKLGSSGSKKHKKSDSESSVLTSDSDSEGDKENIVKESRKEVKQSQQRKSSDSESSVLTSSSDSDSEPEQNKNETKTKINSSAKVQEKHATKKNIVSGKQSDNDKDYVNNSDDKSDPDAAMSPVISSFLKPNLVHIKSKSREISDSDFSTDLSDSEPETKRKKYSKNVSEGLSKDKRNESANKLTTHSATATKSILKQGSAKISQETSKSEADSESSELTSSSESESESERKQKNKGNTSKMQEPNKLSKTEISRDSKPGNETTRKKDSENFSKSSLKNNSKESANKLVTQLATATKSILKQGATKLSQETSKLETDSESSEVTSSSESESESERKQTSKGNTSKVQEPIKLNKAEIINNTRGKKMSESDKNSKSSSSNNMSGSTLLSKNKYQKNKQDEDSSSSSSAESGSDSESSSDSESDSQLTKIKLEKTSPQKNSVVKQFTSSPARKSPQKESSIRTEVELNPLTKIKSKTTVPQKNSVVKQIAPSPAKKSPQKETSIHTEVELNPLRYSIPDKFVISATTKLVSKSEIKGKQLWLIRTPMDFNISTLNGQRVKMSGTQIVNAGDESERQYEVMSTPQPPGQVSNLFGLGTKNPTKEEIYIGPEIHGQIHVMDWVPEMPPVEFTRPAPVRHRVPDNLKPTFKPFGSLSPNRKETESPANGNMSKGKKRPKGMDTVDSVDKKKKKRHSRDKSLLTSDDNTMPANSNDLFRNKTVKIEKGLSNYENSDAVKSKSAKKRKKSKKDRANN